MIRSRNVVPGLKDKKINLVLTLTAIPAANSAASNLFRDSNYDYDVININALVLVATTAVASPFEVGHGAYTDSHGAIQIPDTNEYLDNAHCVDNTGRPFSTGILPVGTMFDILMVSNKLILPAGAPLVLSGATTANTGVCMVTVTLRPKDKDRGDFSKRPGGDSDSPYTSYYK